MLVVAGIAAVIIGGLLMSGIGKSWLGQLPGDLSGEKGGMKFFVPITTCIVISIILTLVFSLFRKG